MFLTTLSAITFRRPSFLSVVSVKIFHTGLNLHFFLFYFRTRENSPQRLTLHELIFSGNCGESSVSLGSIVNSIRTKYSFNINSSKGYVIPIRRTVDVLDHVTKSWPSDVVLGEGTLRIFLFFSFFFLFGVRTTEGSGIFVTVFFSRPDDSLSPDRTEPQKKTLYCFVNDQGRSKS